MSIRGFCAALALSFLATGAAGQDFTIEERGERFRLFAGCGLMMLLVEQMHEDAAKIGLTREALRAAGESRLRSARLYTAEADQYLYVHVNVTGHAFSARLQYKKRVFDFLSDDEGWSTTWDTGGTGTHGGDSGYILSFVSELLDRFLVEFLRVNEVACGKR